MDAQQDGSDSPDQARWQPSRRALLGAALGSAVAAAIPVGVYRFRHHGPQYVTPLAASEVLAGMAVASHPNFASGTYAETEAWVSRLAATGVRRFRGLYDPSNAGCQAAVQACREYGVTWIMLVVPEGLRTPTDQTPAQTTAIVRQVADSCPDVCAALEGINEPDHNRSGAHVPMDWATAYAAPHQRAIWDAARASPELDHVEVIGPSLHDSATMASYRSSDAPGGPQHFEQLAATGIASWFDRLGLHHYPSGSPPMTGVAQRRDLVGAAFGDDVRIHMTETGYTNALYQPTNAEGSYVATEPSFGNRPTSEVATAIYLPRAFLQLAAEGVPAVWYELLDDVDPGKKDVTESNFGLWRAADSDPSSWSPKPAVEALATVAASLSESAGPSYRPTPVKLQLSAPDQAQVTSVLTARRDGTVTVHLFNDLPVWEPVHRRDLEVAPVAVTVTDDRGPRTLEVGPRVVSVDLR